MALSPRRVIQCPRDATLPEVAPPAHNVATMACFSSSMNGLTPIWLLSITLLHSVSGWLLIFNLGQSD
uniref:Uncharacterized protein n=1 Tax=Mesocestoides corti TaxID=53468 RepID=A0A5K3G6X0_MESCO